MLNAFLPQLLFSVRLYPTGPFAISEPQDQEIGEFYVVQKRRATDFDDPKTSKGRSGGVKCLKIFSFLPRRRSVSANASLSSSAINNRDFFSPPAHSPLNFFLSFFLSFSLSSGLNWKFQILFLAGIQGSVGISTGNGFAQHYNKMKRKRRKNPPPPD